MKHDVLPRVSLIQAKVCQTRARAAAAPSIASLPTVVCGRYELHTPIEDLARAFDARLTPGAGTLPPRYNVAPTLAVPVVRYSPEGRSVESMTWGLVPSWAKSLSGAKPINARAESIFDSPMFRNAIRRRRCLIPADGFYEWQSRPRGKQPYHLGMVDGRLFAFGGIWEYRAREGEPPRLTCAIIVTRANELLAGIHDRMPVIIAPDDYAAWLDPGVDTTSVAGMLEPYPAELMRGYPIGMLVNNVKNEGPDLLEPLSSGALP